MQNKFFVLSFFVFSQSRCNVPSSSIESIRSTEIKQLSLDILRSSLQIRLDRSVFSFLPQAERERTPPPVWGHTHGQDQTVNLWSWRHFARSHIKNSHEHSYLWIKYPHRFWNDFDIRGLKDQRINTAVSHIRYPHFPHDGRSAAGHGSPDGPTIEFRSQPWLCLCAVSKLRSLKVRLSQGMALIDILRAVSW